MSPRARASTAPAVKPRARRSASGEVAAPIAATPSRPLIRVSIEVRWRDLDAFHHVNNSTFLTYIEEARLRWFQSLSGPWLSDDTAPVLASSHVDYRRPIEWPATIAVELVAGRVGTTSLTLAHRIVDANAGQTLYSDGYSVLVWIDRRSGKAAPLPEAVRAACDAAD